jgi:transcriptional regulator with XRE-family HTH domain
MKAAERLKEFRAEQKLTMRALADALGVTSSIVSDWESGKSEIRKPNALAMELLYGVSWKWLLNGEQPKRVESKPPRNAQSIPLLDGLPSCGPSGAITDLGPHSEETVFSAGLIQEVLRQCGAGSVETLFAARVQGDSMKPLLEPGDTILVNTALPLRLEPKKNALHLVRKAVGSSEVRVKRLFLSGGVLILRSENQEAFPDRDVQLGDTPIQDLVIGRVCWYGRNLVAPPAKSPDDW